MEVLYIQLHLDCLYKHKQMNLILININYTYFLECPCKSIKQTIFFSCITEYSNFFVSTIYYYKSTFGLCHDLFISLPVKSHLKFPHSTPSGLNNGKTII